MTRSTPATPPARRRTVLGAALLVSAALGLGLLSACGTGQITGTDTQVPVVPGVSGTSADGLILLRDGMVDYADEYEVGATVPLSVRLFNNGKQAVKLTGASAADGEIVLVGGASAAASPSAASPSAAASSASPTPSGSRKPSGSASASASSSASASASPSASPTPTSVGTAKISVEIPIAGFVALSHGNGTYLAIAKLSGTALKAGGAIADVKLTFTYADGSTTTIELPEVPMNVPLTALPKPSPIVHDEAE